ncbi:manganese-dependent inorganic pyrophosphatase [Allofustis seminis]|uniref:manganese-dependent inorganic pyrophosphatase n=1 Tax=Allofustis seminis TaxID=166939 RepID=UPI00035E412B|nr:manganese-dependent inorganic pyrophosphatase [Allofustis seminis]
MVKTLIFGHKNPDTDAIGAAISFAHFVNEQGGDAEAVALGHPNDETAYALKYFNIQAPRIIQTAANEVDEVMLVDHNEKQQSVDDIEEVTVKAVVDHHRIANFETADPLFYRAEPLGCTCTILYKMYQESGIEIPKNIAGIMMSAIISDSLLFKSPTCTPKDVEVANKLAEIAGVNIEEYGLEMLKAGTNISSKTAAEILNADAKTFDMNERVVRIGQVNVVDFEELTQRKGEILEAMKEETDKHYYDLFVLLITNILDSDSIGLVYGPGYREMEMAFDRPVQMNTIDLPGVVSRKKQVVPQLTEAFNN